MNARPLILSCWKRKSFTRRISKVRTLIACRNHFINTTQFVAYDERFFDIIGPDAQVEHVQHLAYQSHESPCYNLETKQLFFAEWGPPGGHDGEHSWQYILDTETNELHNITTDPPVVNAHGCVIFKRMQYIVTDGNHDHTGMLVKVDPRTMESSVVLNNYYQQPFLGFNDLDIDSEGNFWLTDSKSAYVSSVHITLRRTVIESPFT